MREFALASLGVVTAGVGPLLFHARRHVARYRNCSARRDSCASLHEGEGHLDVELASGSVGCTGHRWSALQLRLTIPHGGFEAAPMGRPQVFGDDQVETMTARLRSAIAEQVCIDTVPSPDRLVVI